MKNNLLLFFIVLTLPIGAFSQTYNYAPNMLNIPCLTNKGDAILGFGWGRGLVFQALEIQAVYSPAKHLAVMANYFGPRKKSVRNHTDVGTDFYLWEAAIGIYEKLPKGAASLFAGFSSGNLCSHYGADRTAEFEMKRWFIQPGINYQSHQFQAGLALRLSNLIYRKGLVSYTIDAQDFLYIKNLEKDSPMFLPEIGVQFGMHLKPVTINLNVTSIFPNTSDWNFSSLNTGLSIAVKFGKKK